MKLYLRKPPSAGRDTTDADNSTNNAKYTLGANNAVGAWETGCSLRLDKGLFQTDITKSSDNTTATRTNYLYRGFSEPLAAATFGSGTWTLAVMVDESNANADSLMSCSVYIFRPSTQSVVGFIYDASTDLGAEWAATGAGQVVTFSGSDVAAQDGDVLVVEFFRNTDANGQAMATAYAQVVAFEGTIDVTAGSTTSAASYLDSPASITFLDSSLIRHRSMSESRVASGTTVSPAVPAGVADNDILLAFIKAPTGVTITPPSGWTSIRVVDDATRPKFESFWKRASSESGTYDFTQSGAAAEMTAMVGAYTGFSVHSGDPIDTSNGASGSAAGSFDAPTLTTAVANERLIAAWSLAANARACTAETEIEQRWDMVSVTNGAGAGRGFADKRIASASQATGAITISVAIGDAWMAQSILLRDPVSAATTAYKDAPSRFKLWAQSIRDAATRFRLATFGYKDIATRVKVYTKVIRDVMLDSPQSFWRLNEASGNALDFAASVAGTPNANVRRSRPGLADADGSTEFDSASWIDLGDNYDRSGTSSYSIEAWARPDRLDLDRLVSVNGARSDWRLEDTSGTTAVDSVAAHNGSYNGGYTLGVPGPLSRGGTAVRFDGTAWVQVAHHADLNLGDTLTIEAWVRPRTLTSAAPRTIVSKQADGYNVRLAADGKVQIVKSFAAIIVESTVAVQPSVWTHILVTKTGATVKIYIDNIDRTGTVTNQTLVDNGSDLLIGMEQSSIEFFDGDIARVSVYPTVLGNFQRGKHFYAASTGVYPGAFTYILRKLNSGFSHGYGMYWHPTRGFGVDRHIDPTYDDCEASVVTSHDVAFGIAHHVVGTYDGTNLRLYVDGELRGTLASSLSLADMTLPLVIGSSFHDSETVGFTGLIEKVAVWNGVLTPERIRAHYRAGNWGATARVRFRLAAQGFRDAATRFVLSSAATTAYKDIATRFVITVQAIRDAATRFVLQGRNYRDIATRFVLSVASTSYRDVATRVVVQALSYVDVVARFRIDVRAYRDIPSRVVVVAQSIRDAPSRFVLTVQMWVFAPIRFVLSARSYKDVPTRVVLIARGYKDAATRFVLSISVSRLYLRDLTSLFAPTAGSKSATLPVAAGTNNSGATFESLSMLPTKGVAQTTREIDSDADANHHDQYIARYASPPLAPSVTQINAGTWTIAIAFEQENADANSELMMPIYVWRPSTTSIVGFIHDAHTALGAEWSPTEDGIVATLTGAEVSGIAGGDVIVAEVWRHTAGQG